MVDPHKPMPIVWPITVDVVLNPFTNLVFKRFGIIRCRYRLDQIIKLL